MLLAPDGQHALVSTASLFHSQQLFWPFGVPSRRGGRPARRDGRRPRLAVGDLPPADRRLAAAAGRAALAPRPRRREDALALLALLFLARCALDPWNIHYYHLPLVLALLAWEVERRRRLPVLSPSSWPRCGCRSSCPARTTATGLFVALHGLGAPARRLPVLAVRRAATLEAPMARRTDQRRAAVFALYQHDLTGRPLDDMFERDAAIFTRALAHATADNVEDLDPLIERHATGWSLDRIAPLERAIMRTALLEMLHPDLVEGDRPIPPEGAIDEAVETAKAFCGADAPGFVNGILAAALREARGSAV